MFPLFTITARTSKAAPPKRTKFKEEKVLKAKFMQQK